MSERESTASSTPETDTLTYPFQSTFLHWLYLEPPNPRSPSEHHHKEMLSRVEADGLMIAWIREPCLIDGATTQSMAVYCGQTPQQAGQDLLDTLDLGSPNVT